MPRPANGYRNAAGVQIPATHDPISRYMDRSALMIWAHKRGEQGLPLWARDAIDIGATVHAMADLDLQGRPDKEIEKAPHDAGLPRDDFDKAMRAFMQFRKWRIGCHVQPISLEQPFVSETYQYGGTPDCIAIIDGKVALVEFKTSVKPFPDHLVAMAAHARLWNENHPEQPIQVFHWIGLPKDGSEFQHHSYADLSAQWEIFTLYLDAWRLEKGLTRKRTAKPKTVCPSPKSKLAADLAASVAEASATRPKDDGLDIPSWLRRSPQPAAPAAAAPAIVVPGAQICMTEIRPQPPVQLSMAEILRMNGLVPQLEEAA